MTKATVLMSVYNTQPYLQAAVDSILTQTFADFEFLVFDDGSTDGSRAILETYQDPRMSFFPDNHNKGLVYRYNQGIERARGEYIFLMDADDVAVPERLERQIHFLDSHPEIGLCGGWMQSIYPDYQLYPTPSNHDDIIVNLLKGTTFFHPTVAVRKELLQRHGLRYKEEFLYAEDYRLWLEIVQVTRVANLPEVLLRYRDHEQSVSKRYYDRQMELVNRLRREQFEKLLGRALDAQEYAWITYELDFNQKIAFGKLRRFVREIMQRNAEKQYYEPAALYAHLLKKMVKIYNNQPGTTRIRYLWNTVMLLVFFPELGRDLKHRPISRLFRLPARFMQRIRSSFGILRPVR